MAAFTAEDQTDRRAFSQPRRTRLHTRASRSTESSMSTEQSLERWGPPNRQSARGDLLGTTRTQWGKGIASAALQIRFLPRLSRIVQDVCRAASDNRRFASSSLEKAGFRRVWRQPARSATAAAVRRSRRRSCASTEVGNGSRVCPLALLAAPMPTARAILDVPAVVLGFLDGLGFALDSDPCG